jgi:hypothetical protein
MLPGVGLVHLQFRLSPLRWLPLPTLSPLAPSPLLARDASACASPLREHSALDDIINKLMNCKFTNFYRCLCILGTDLVIPVYLFPSFFKVYCATVLLLRFRFGESEVETLLLVECNQRECHHSS